MAVSAAAAFFVVMVVTTAVATAFAVVAVVVSAAAASACQVLDEVLYLVVGGLTVLNHSACKIERLTSQGMVGVEGDAVFLNLQDFGHESVVFVVHQGDDGAFVDVVVVEVAVDHECLPAQFVNALWVVCSKGVCWFQSEIEC